MQKHLIRMFIFVASFAVVSCASFSDKHTIRMGKTSDIKVTDMKVLDVNGLAAAQVTVENRGNSKPVQYRFKWLDEKGQQVWNDESWKPLLVESGRVAVIEGVAPTLDATDFRFELDSY